MSEKIMNHRELKVFQSAHSVAMQIFQLTKTFPREELYSLTDQIRRSSRSVCANIAEAWRKRRYEAAFISKLSDAEAESAETQVWIQFSVECGYLSKETGVEIYRAYNLIIRTLVGMINHPETWVFAPNSKANKRT